MAEHRIVCVSTEEHHRHVLSVGTGDDPLTPRLGWPVAEVFKALVAGDSFYTVSPSTGARAGVEVEQCQIDGCVELTIRSTAGSIADNNLDNVGACNWI